MLNTPSNSHDASEATGAYGLHSNSQILSGRLNSCKIILISQLLPRTSGMIIGFINWTFQYQHSTLTVQAHWHTFQWGLHRGLEHILVLGVVILTLVELARTPVPC